MKKIFLLFIAIFLSLNAFAQSRPYLHIKGRVVDLETGESIPGANLKVKGSKGFQKGTSTNFDGLFSMDKPAMRRHRHPYETNKTLPKRYCDNISLVPPLCDNII